MKRAAKRILNMLPVAATTALTPVDVMLREFMKACDLAPVLMDIGAAGCSPKPWRPLAPTATIVGFEPDERNPDVKFGRGFKRSIMLSKVVVPDDQADEVDFILTENPSCSSLLEPDLEALGSFSFRDLFKVSRRTKLPATSLNRILAEHDLAGAHWIKVDAQGADLNLIKSLSEDNHRTLLAVDIEPGFIHAYKEEALFPECHTWLDQQGFWLADLQYQAYAKIRPETIEFFEKQGWNKKKLIAGLKKSPTAAEAFYMRRVSWLEREAKDSKLWLLAFAIATASNHIGHALDVLRSYEAAFGSGTETGQMAKIAKLALQQS